MKMKMKMVLFLLLVQVAVCGNASMPERIIIMDDVNGSPGVAYEKYLKIHRDGGGDGFHWLTLAAVLGHNQAVISLAEKCYGSSGKCSSVVAVEDMLSRVIRSSNNVERARAYFYLGKLQLLKEGDVDVNRKALEYLILSNFYGSGDFISAIVPVLADLCKKDTEMIEPALSWIDDSLSKVKVGSILYTKLVNLKKEVEKEIKKDRHS